MVRGFSGEVHSCSAGNEITRPVWNPKVYDNFHKSLTLFPTLSQVHIQSNPQSIFLEEML